MNPKLTPENARGLRDALRNYKAAMARLESAENEQEIVEAAEAYLEAKRNWKGAVERCKMQLRRDREQG